ncbi:MAG: hypothetical protein HYY06_27710 [Deltaproteobacteria bacterium]|nr:hypothetical protein [Deltaproteobacteria bacterium]
MDYLLVLRPHVPLKERPVVPGSAKVECHGDEGLIERIEVSFSATDTPERFSEEVRGWLEVAERGGMAVFDPQLGRQVGRADLGELLDCRARSLSYALGVLGDTVVAVTGSTTRTGLPGWAWAAFALALVVLALRFCSGLAG